MCERGTSIPVPGRTARPGQSQRCGRRQYHSALGLYPPNVSVVMASSFVRKNPSCLRCTTLVIFSKFLKFFSTQSATFVPQGAGYRDPYSHFVLQRRPLGEESSRNSTADTRTSTSTCTCSDYRAKITEMQTVFGVATVPQNVSLSSIISVISLSSGP